MNIYENYLEDNNDIQKYLKHIIYLLQEKNTLLETSLENNINEINNQLHKQNNLIEHLQKTIETLNNKIDIIESNLNKKDFIESYKNLRKGVPFPYSSILSKEPFGKNSID